jgi:hypothetical protein
VHPRHQFTAAPRARHIVYVGALWFSKTEPAGDEVLAGETGPSMAVSMDELSSTDPDMRSGEDARLSP